LRCSEAANLTQDCVDFQKNELIIRNTKGGKSRRNNMLPAIRSLLKIWLTYRGELGHDYVFTTLRHKKPIRTDIIRALLNKYLKKSGIDLKNRHITVHSLRHSFISHMLSPEIGASIGKVSRFVGHQSITMTMKYSHFDEMEKDEYLEKFTVPVC
jgi:integrase